MSEEEKFIKFKEIYDEMKKQYDYLEKEGFNDEQILIIEKLIANKEYLAKQELHNKTIGDEVVTSQELSKYKELYRKALDNTIKSDRELLRYKEINKKAIEYIKNNDYNKLGGGTDCIFNYLLEILEAEDVKD